MGILFLVVGLDQGWTSGKLTVIIGLFMSLVGGGSIWKPETIGKVLSSYLERFRENQSGTRTQTQHNPKNSPQAYVEKGTIHQTIYTSEPQEKKKKKYKR